MSSRNLNQVVPPAKLVQALCLSGQDLEIGEIHSVAAEGRAVTVTDDPAVFERMEAAELLVREAVESGCKIYGMTTGFGGMAEVAVPQDEVGAAQSNLLAFLACGAGNAVAVPHVRAAMLLRANMLLRGASGVRREIVDRMVMFLNADATPIVGDLGSIGASGDLVPLSIIARAITGHPTSCRVRFAGKVVSSQEALEALGLAPIDLIPKEALAIVNGTSFSTAIAVNCLRSSKNFLALSLASHTMMIRALLGYEEPFLPFVHECKPHPGQVWTASMMRRLMGIQTDPAERETKPHLQDRYSLRCLPQYFGPLVESLLRVERTLETEMNSVTDNPLIDTEQGRFLQSGNFLGQYVGMAMDDLRRILGLLAKHLDVQIALLVTPEFSHGLPASLAGAEQSPVNMGLKGLQITGNSIMPMLTYFGNPLVEHFPTHAEQYNQNVNGLSWGAANLAARSVELYETYASVALLFAVQSVDLRARALEGHHDGRSLLGPLVIPLYEAVYSTVGRTPGTEKPLIGGDADQSLEVALANLSASIRGNGAIVEAVEPIVDSLNESALSR